ncbi:hypothetical protein [Kiloniella sp.]|uniref:hypothetical protein n=1 Tax=Kiloniella sp. TaxID=1938587 RepID=UPI003A8DA0EA
MAESRGRPGSHGPGGRNSNNNGNGNQGPDFGGGGDRDRDRPRNTRGFQPSPAPVRGKTKTFSISDGIHSPEAQAAATEAHRRANRIGVYAGLGPEKIDFDDMKALSQYPTGTPKNIAAKKEHQKSLARSYRGSMSSTLASLGSSLLSGVNSEFTVDDEGNIGFRDSYAPTDQALSFGLRSANPIIGGLSKLSDLASFAGYSPHQSVSGFRSIGEATDQRVKGDQQRRAAREGDNGSSKLKSLTERAQQVLYPQEEDKPQFGVGVSQGKSKVRRAPQLSALNVKRKQYGRG